MQEVLRLDAEDQASLIRTGELSARELTEACLQRMESLEPKLHATLAIDGELSMEHAKRADDALASKGQAGSVGPLHGVPFAVKDLIHARGWSTTFGSRCFDRSGSQRSDSAVVHRLRKAGAIMIAKANTPEFGLAAETVNALQHPTANPWDLTRTAGGSSGGSAALVASGSCALALGTDCGGSVRLPSSWCGVLGLKPTAGKVPTVPVIPGFVNPTDTIGPIVRSSRDASTALRIIAGHDASDPQSRRIGVSSDVTSLPPDVDELRVAWSPGFGLGTAEEDIEATVEEVATRLASAGLHVEQGPDFVGEVHPFMIMFSMVAVAWEAQVSALPQGSRSKLMEYTRAFVDAGEAISTREFLRMSWEALNLRQRIDAILQENDVLLLPSTAVSAWPHGRPPAEVRGQPLAQEGGVPFGGLPFLAAFSATGHPAVTVPAGFDHDGMPIGVQLVGRHDDETTLLRAAALVESLRDSTEFLPDVESALR